MAKILANASLSVTRSEWRGFNAGSNFFQGHALGLGELSASQAAKKADGGFPLRGSMLSRGIDSAKSAAMIAYDWEKRMSYASNERRSTFRGAQVIAFLYSILFFSLIASGYYLLFQDNVFLAITASVLFSLMAWWSARQIGLSKGGIRAHIPLFILLLLISAVGVFNSLMLNLEGRRIFVETIEDSQSRFDQVSKRAATELAKGGTSSPLARMQRVESLKAALFSEIRNPLNCGQGPEARKILASLGEELADFRPLSNPRVDCSQNVKVIEDYERKIGELVERAPWSNQ